MLAFLFCLVYKFIKDLIKNCISSVEPHYCSKENRFDDIAVFCIIYGAFSNEKSPCGIKSVPK